MMTGESAFKFICRECKIELIKFFKKCPHCGSKKIERRKERRVITK